MTRKYGILTCLLVSGLLLAGCGDQHISQAGAETLGGGSPTAPAASSPSEKGTVVRAVVPVPSTGQVSRETLSPARAPSDPGKRRVVPFHRTPRPIDLGDPFQASFSTQVPSYSPQPLAPGPSALAPVLDNDPGFIGLPDPGDVIPPDTMGAAGPSSVISTLNSEVGVFDKVTGQPIGTVVDLSQFWIHLTIGLPLNTGQFPFDPRIIYDQEVGRFIFISLTGQAEDIGKSYILLAVSDNSAPTTSPAGWNMWPIPADNVRKTTWADFPCLGLDGKNVYVTANMYDSSDTFRASKVWVIPKTQLLSGNPQATELEWTEFTAPPGSNSTLVPAHTFGPASAEYIVFESGFSTDGFIRDLDIARIDNTGWLKIGSVPVRRYPVSPIPTWTAPQPGAQGGIELNDTRVLGAVFRNGRLFVTHHVPDDTSRRSEVAWYEIDPATSPPRLLQEGRISDASLSYYYPSIGVNANGDVAVGFSGSSTTVYAGAYFTARTASDSNGTMQTVGVLKAGANTYYKTLNNTENRWGDYSATVIDPTDDLTFWTVQEYVAAKDTWGTWWGKFHLSDLAASALSTDSIRVTWVDQYTTETGFTVERSSSAQGPFEAIATEPPGTTSHIDNGLSEATRYFYRVLVNQDTITLGPDNTVTLPAAPDNLVATKVSSYSIRLTWRDNSAGEAGYKVERGLPGTGFAVVKALPANTTTYTDSSLPGSTTFQYRVVAFTGGGDSFPSNTALATTDPPTSSGGGGCLSATGAPAEGDPMTNAACIVVLLLPAAMLLYRKCRRFSPGEPSLRHPPC